jgi:hypothetical protein
VARRRAQAALDLVQEAIEQSRRHHSPYEVAIAAFEAVYCATVMGEHEKAAIMHGFGLHELAVSGAKHSPPERSELKADLKCIAAQLGQDWRAAYKRVATLSRENVREIIVFLTATDASGCRSAALRADSRRHPLASLNLPH